MTRDEAISTMLDLGFEEMNSVGVRRELAGKWVDCLVALGVLNLDVSLSERAATLGPKAFSVRNVADVMGEQRASDWREPIRCEPPPEHQDKTFHWLRLQEDAEVRLAVHEWRETRTWEAVGLAAAYTPKELSDAGWRYVAPCLPPTLEEMEKRT